MSDSSTKESRPLEVLKEQASPDYPPFDNELYGETISIVESRYVGHVRCATVDPIP
jgi:hypothetical protein